MKVRLKPAFRSRLLATGVSFVAFVAIVSGFAQEWQDLVPEESVNLVGANDPLLPEVLVTQTPIPTVAPESTASPDVGPSAASSPSPVSSTSPTAKPTKSGSPNTFAPSPSATRRPTAKPTVTAAPSVNPSPTSAYGVAPATPAKTAAPEVVETAPEQDAVVYTCISPGGTERDLVAGRCLTKWGYVLTQKPQS